MWISRGSCFILNVEYSNIKTDKGHCSIFKKGYRFSVTVSYEEMFERAKGFFREQRISLCPVGHGRFCHVIQKNIPDALRKCCCCANGEGEGESGTTPIVPIALIDNM